MAGARAAVVASAVLMLSMATGVSAASVQPRVPYPHRFCHPVSVHHDRIGVDGSDALTCRFMRRWTVRFLRDGREPRHWRCVDLGDGGDCHRPYHRPLWFEWYL